MTANKGCIRGEVVFPRLGFRALPYATKLQRRYLHRLEYGDQAVVGIVPKGVSLSVEALDASFRFIPDHTVDRPSGVTEPVEVGGEYKPMEAAASSSASDLRGYAAIDRAARRAGFRLRVVSAEELRWSSFLSNAAFIESHGWRKPPEEWLLAGTKAFSHGKPSGIDDLQAAMPDGVHALLLALHLAWLGKIAFADDERVSRHSHFASETVGNRTNNPASVRSSLRSAA